MINSAKTWNKCELHVAKKVEVDYKQCWAQCITKQHIYYTSFSNHIIVTIMTLIELQRSFSYLLSKKSADLRSWEMGITFAFIARKDNRVMGTCKLHPGQKQPYCCQHSTALCKHLHKQHSNTKQAKKLE